MKKVLISFSALLLVVMMAVSCNKQGPKDVATTWLNSFYHMDYESAKKVSTEDTKNLLNQLSQLTGMISDSSKKEMKKINVVVKDVKEDGDKAKVTYALSDQPTKEMPLDLVKKDGKWLVQFSKNDGMGGGATENGAEPAPADSTGGAAPAPGNAPVDASDTTKH